MQNDKNSITEKQYNRLKQMTEYINELQGNRFSTFSDETFYNTGDDTHGL